jgi:hypothetical protein
VKKDGFVARTFNLTVRPGAVLAQQVELEAVPPPPRPEPRAPRPAPRELLAPGERSAPVPAPAPVAAPPAADENAEPGYLVADTTPWARLIVDGQDTGKMTPIAARARIAISAGKHVVTFVVGEEKFSYTIMVEPGQEYSLKKDLPVETR